MQIKILFSVIYLHQDDLKIIIPDQKKGIKYTFISN